MRRPHRPRSPVEKPYGLINAFLDQPYPYPLPPEKPEPPMTLIPPKKPPYGGYGRHSPVARNFRDQIAELESGPGGNYQASNPTKGGVGALGRYQLRSGALNPTGFLDDQNQWTGKRGIGNAEDFLNDPESQEWAFAEFMRAMETDDLAPQRAFGLRNVGQVVTSPHGDFTITKSGLMAAAHRRGGVAVRDYLAFVAQNGWHSDLDALPAKYQQIETRLRAFENTVYDRPHR
jgi:hypothetical protein